MKLEIRSIDGPAGALRLGWALPASPAAATLLMLQGRGELLEKYPPIAEVVTGWGFAFLSLDWRGQGGSARIAQHPRKGHVARFEDYLDDLDAALAAARSQGLPPVRHVMGLSMGGHIALRALGDRRLAVERAVLVAPMCDIRMSVPHGLARALCRLATALGQGQRWAPGQADGARSEEPFAGTPLTSDPVRYAAWRRLQAEHPEKAIGGVTYGWLGAALRSIEVARDPAYLRGIAAECLFIAAEDERICDNSAIREAAERVPGARHSTIQGGRHDLLMAGDAERRPMLQEIGAFLTSR